MTAAGGPGPAALPAPALAEWRAALGPGHVRVGGEDLERAGQATFATGQRSPALLLPGDREAVAACLRIAARHGVAVYPLSGGRNWGYGSRVPPRDGTVLLSLARLDRIVAHDEDLAYVTLEPGVTFAMLGDFLCRRGSRLLPPMTGAPPGASVVGNVLERGIGKGPYEDIAARSCAYEVVLPSGEVIHTGFAAHPHARVAALRAEGPGPALQGLFAQGNLGVVTQLTVWLQPAPALRQRVFFRLTAGGELEVAVDRLRGLLLRGATDLQVEIVNDYRVLAMQGQFPFDRRDGGEALSRGWVEGALSPLGGARWYGCATLWAEDGEELQWRRRRLAAALADLEGGLDPEVPAPGADAAGSSEAGIRSTYWRKREPPPADPDPDRDRCGVIWVAPVLPMVGEEAASALAAIEETALGAGLEPSISLRPVGGRAMQAVVGLMYDRDAPGADARASACHLALRRLLEARGLIPYRLGLLDFEAPPAQAAANAELLRALKRLLDPAGILAPGRYIPGERGEGP